MFVYAAVFFLWPSVVFHGHLRGRSISYRFAFCTLVPFVIFTTVISLLGVVGLLSTPLVAFLYYGVFFVQLFRFHNPFPKLGKHFHRIHNKTLTWKRVFFNDYLIVRNGVSRGMLRLWRTTAGNRLRYVMLLIALIYGTLYFSYPALQFHSYGASDQYVHNAWISALTEGTIYPKGIYPEGMHCVVYVMSALFGVKIYSVNLFLAGVHVHAVLLAAYLLMREFFSWKFTPVFVLFTLLTVNVLSVDSIAALSRLSWTLPQEIAFPAVFLSAYALLRFLKRRETEGTKGFSWKELLTDEDLLLFAMAVSCTIMLHFYATVMAAFLCAVIFLFYFFRRFRWQKLWKLVLAGLLALILAIAPMGVALARGYKFQGSLHWAIAVTKGGEKAWAEGRYDENTIKAEKDQAKAETNQAKAETNQKPSRSILLRLKDWTWTLYDGTWQQLYPGERGEALCLLALAMAVFSALGAGEVAWLRRRRRNLGQSVSEENAFLGYLCIACSLLLLMVEYSPKLAGLPIIISGSRLCAMIELYAVAVCFCLVDILFYALKGCASEPAMNLVSAAVCLGIYALFFFTGHFHGYLYNELTRYPKAVDLTERIILYVPKEKYTIVSTTDEYYQILGHGFHEELIDFTESRRDRTYTLPTPYIFVFIEKAPLSYDHVLCASGPRWIASNAYYDVISRYRMDTSIYPAILHGTTSQELAANGKMTFSKRSDAASVLSNREVLESQALQWLEIFSAAHPQDGSVVYEDESFLCYCIHQNEQSLFSLGIVE